GPVFLRRTDKEWSVFAQDIISLQDNVKLHLGLRHLHISRIQFDNPGYDQGKFLTTAALVYKPSQAISVYGSYAQGLEHGGIAPT
ncbi:TonB-dependent receptor, partial [Acinetobacter baumannii]